MGLQEVFQKVEPSSMGFKIELKFDDNIDYHQDHLIHVLQGVLQVVLEYAKDKPIIFSSFQPDAALLVRKLHTTYPVFFLTNGGSEIYYDVRRNSLEEAIKLCLEGGLQGIVSEVKGIFRNPVAVNKINDSNLQYVVSKVQEEEEGCGTHSFSSYPHWLPLEFVRFDQPIYSFSAFFF